MFITFEGPDGSGKSTHSKLLKERLEKEGKTVKLVHFPRYESHIGGFIGKILSGEVEVPTFDALQMLYVSDQLDFQKELEEDLKNGVVVIADRYDLSTLAYYSTKTNCSDHEVFTKVYGRWQSGLRKPDLTYVFAFNGDLDERRKNTGKVKDIIEQDDNITNNISETYMRLSETMEDREFYYLSGLCDKQMNSELIYKHFNIMQE